MNRLARGLGAAALSMALGACSTHYHTLALDQKTDRYPTSTQVDAGGVLSFVSSTDPTSFPIVLLVTNANIRPSGFEFTVRSALAQLGAHRVLTVAEFRNLANDRGFRLVDDKINAEAVRRFSAEVAPVLVIDASYLFVGDARMRVGLVAVDGRSGQPLLRVDHPRLVWSDFDGEALYPVLNELRRWYRASAKGGQA